MHYDRPLFFVPNLRTDTDGYPWGKPIASSNILAHLPGKSQSSEAVVYVKNNSTVVSERWMCSDDPAKGSLVETNEGPKTFRSLLEEDGALLLGPAHVVQYGNYLHSLMKLLDTNDDTTKGSLSVQIHPKAGHPSRPSRTEMWKGEGYLYIGWKEEMTADKIRQAFAEGTIESYLLKADLKPEQLILVEGGTIHAIRARTFLAEWSGAPGADELLKGNIADASVALWDRTDGKQPRPGKEDVEGTINILEHADGMHALTLEDAYHVPQMLELDQEGNLLRKLFATSSVHVDEYQIATSVELSLLYGGLPLYVDSGTVRICQGEEVLAELPAGSECFLPFAMGNVTLQAVEGPAIVQMWYAPLNGVERRI